MCGGCFAPVPLCLWLGDSYPARVTDDWPLEVDRQKGEGKRFYRFFFLFSDASTCLVDLIWLLAQINYCAAVIRERVELPPPSFPRSLSL